jgi:hypothetical protein
MTKSEFISKWSAIREQYLRKAYKGKPHGEACLIMSLCDMPQEAEELWREHRRALKPVSIAEFTRNMTTSLDLLIEPGKGGLQ